MHSKRMRLRAWFDISGVVIWRFSLSVSSLPLLLVRVFVEFCCAVSFSSDAVFYMHQNKPSYTFQNKIYCIFCSRYFLLWIYYLGALFSFKCISCFHFAWWLDIFLLHITFLRRSFVCVCCTYIVQCTCICIMYMDPRMLNFSYFMIQKSIGTVCDFGNGNNSPKTRLNWQRNSRIMLVWTAICSLFSMNYLKRPPSTPVPIDTTTHTHIHNLMPPYCEISVCNMCHL